MTNKRRQIQKAYDMIATTYEEETDKNEEQEAQIQILNEFADSIESNATILDAGCGGKPATLDGTKTVGLDFSRGQLEKYTGDTVPLVQGDMTNLPFNNNSFDGVTAFFSMIHIPLDEHQTVCDEFARVVRPNSPVLLTEGTDEWVGSHDSWLESGEEMKWEMAGKEATISHLENAGFEIQQIVPVRDTLGETDGTKLFFLAQLTD